MNKFLIGAAAAAITAVPANAVSVVGATSIYLTSAAPTYIQVTELQAFTFGSVNVALASNGGTAIGSSVWEDGSAVAGKAIDGVFPADYPELFHSKTSDAGEFLSINFAAPATLASITIYGRNGCCTDRDIFNINVYGGEQLLYSGTINAVGGPGTVTFDAPGVPEPQTWALLVAGFGLVGVSMRRRKSASVAA